MASISTPSFLLLGPLLCGCPSPDPPPNPVDAPVEVARAPGAAPTPQTEATQIEPGPRGSRTDEPGETKRGGLSTIIEEAKRGPCIVRILPASTRGGAAPDHPTVQVGARDLCYQGEPVVSLAAGRMPDDAVTNHLVASLYDAIERDKEDDPEEDPPDSVPARILAPPDLPFSQLVDILYTMGRGGFRQYYLGVQGPQGDRGTLRVDPPKFTMGRSKPSLAIFILSDGLRITPRGGLSAPGAQTIPLAHPSYSLSNIERWNLPRLGTLIDTLKRTNPEVVNATISAERDIPLGVLVAVFDVVAGEDCPPHTDEYEVAGERCRLPSLTIEAGAG